MLILLRGSNDLRIRPDVRTNSAVARDDFGRRRTEVGIAQNEAETPRPMADVFISYKSERRPAVHHLARVLENHGYSVWFDYRLLSGEEFAPQIERELRAAGAVIVLWCSLSTESEWVKDEARIAKELKTLIPARIEAASLPLGHGGLDTIDLASWDGNPRVGAALDRLLGQLSIKVSRDPVLNYRALSEQEAQWRVHRKGLAEFPLDETTKNLDEKWKYQRQKKDNTNKTSTYKDGYPASGHVKWIFQRQKIAGSFFNSEIPSFSRDGRFIIVCDYTTGLLFDAQSGHVVKRIGDVKNRIFGAHFSPDGRRILSRSYDNHAHVWDIETGTILATLKGHTAPITRTAFSSNGRRIVTESEDRTARVWDSVTGRKVTMLYKRNFLGIGDNIVQSPSFSPDGRRIVTASRDCTARVWDAESGRVLIMLPEHPGPVSDAIFSPDGRRIMTHSYDSTGSYFGAARVWDSGTGHHVATLAGQKGQLLSAAFSPDGRRIVTTEAGGRRALVLDSETGRVLLKLEGHNDITLSAEFSPDGSRIITASWDKTARVWHAESGQLVATLNGHADKLEHAAFSPDGRRIFTASEDGKVRLWELS